MVAGGMESMSNAPYLLPRARSLGGEEGAVLRIGLSAEEEEAALMARFRASEVRAKIAAMPMSVEQIESLRRSHAMSALPNNQVAELLENHRARLSSLRALGAYGNVFAIPRGLSFAENCARLAAEEATFAGRAPPGGSRRRRT